MAVWLMMEQLVDDGQVEIFLKMIVNLLHEISLTVNFMIYTTILSSLFCHPLDSSASEAILLVVGAIG